MDRQYLSIDRMVPTRHRIVASDLAGDLSSEFSKAVEMRDDEMPWLDTDQTSSRETSMSYSVALTRQRVLPQTDTIFPTGAIDSGRYCISRASPIRAFARAMSAGCCDIAVASLPSSVGRPRAR